MYRMPDLLVNYAARVLASPSPTFVLIFEIRTGRRFLLQEIALRDPVASLSMHGPTASTTLPSQDVRGAWDLLISHRSTTVLPLYGIAIVAGESFRTFLLASFKRRICSSFTSFLHTRENNISSNLRSSCARNEINADVLMMISRNISHQH